MNLLCVSVCALLKDSSLLCLHVLIYNINFTNAIVYSDVPRSYFVGKQFPNIVRSEINISFTFVVVRQLLAVTKYELSSLRILKKLAF